MSSVLIDHAANQKRNVGNAREPLFFNSNGGPTNNERERLKARLANKIQKERREGLGLQEIKGGKRRTRSKRSKRTTRRK